RPLARRDVRRPSGGVPGASAQAVGRDAAHRAAASRTVDARRGARRLRAERGPGGDGAHRRAAARRRLRREEVARGGRARHAGHRAARPPPPEAAARRRGPPDHLDLRSRRPAKGHRVRDRSDARDRRGESERPVSHRRADAPGAPEEGRRGVSQLAGRRCRARRRDRPCEVRERVPDAAPDRGLPARHRRLRDAVSRPEPDHQRDARVRPRCGQGHRVDPVPARARGPGRRPRGARAVPRLRRRRARGESDPRRSRAEAAARAARVRVRQGDGVARHRPSRPRAQARRARRAGGRRAGKPDGGTRAHRMNLGRRLVENPILTAADVQPSLPTLEVVSVFNAAAARVGDEIILLLRGAERPRTDIAPGPDALTLDFDQPHPVLHPLPARYRDRELVGMAFLDARQTPAKVVVAYIPADLPGLDLRDPRSIRYRNNTGYLRTTNDGCIDFLAQISQLRVARSRDGVHSAVDPVPAIAPHTEMEEYGVEDPRATLIDGVWYITYVSVSRWGITTSLATTTDFRSFDREGIIFLPDHKDVVLFPERVNGKFVALTRPMPQSFSRIFGIWIAFSDDLQHWGEHETLALPRWGYWDELRTGASAVPF